MSLNANKKSPSVNITVEGGFDFWAALEKEDKEICDDNICLLTQEPLTLNYITMPCGHKYNYVPICKEISAMKSKTQYYTAGIKLMRGQTFCPYCRQVFNKLLPKIPWDNFTPDKYVCSSTNYIEHRTCQHIFQSGKRKGLCCGKKNAFDTEYGTYCSQHAYKHKPVSSTSIKKSKMKSVGDLDENGMKLWNKYKVIQLKDILRKHKLPVSGAKAILITRLLKANIELD
tara:strand:+ start:401 stop:1087 length:687 start_codon:yes stop_codon:yes gene_type:complete